MSNMAINELSDNTLEQSCDTALATDPFTALKAHYGMLLGVADFQTIDAYHRGKQWLHNAWLHRQGIIWGFGVSLNTNDNEIKVGAGLAVDALGRELHLPQAVCLNVPAWLEKHKEESEVQDAIEIDGDQISLNAHVVIQFKACLARQVPALMEPCEGGGASTAYSRVLETVEVSLRPGPAPQVGDDSRPIPYHRLRLLFNLAEPNEDEGAVVASDQDVLDRRADILDLAAAEQPKAYLEALREFAALECIEMRPALTESGETISNFPAIEPAALVLADLSDIVIENDSVSRGEVDNTVRDTHIATSTIQELLCGPLFSLPIAGEGDLVIEAEDAGGPRVDAQSVELDGQTLSMTHEGPRLLARSLASGVSLFISAYDINSGWSELRIDNVDYDSSARKISVTLAEEPDADSVRIIIKGSGLTPVLATLADSSRVPFAGQIGGPAAIGHSGHDFNHMIKLEG